MAIIAIDILYKQSSIISLSDKTITFLREQNLSKGLEYYNQMLAIAMDTVPSLIEEMHYFNTEAEIVSQDIVNQQLGNLLAAQQDKDYVLLSDILELQWIPFLISLQEYIVGKEGLICQLEIFADNAAALNNNNSGLADKLRKLGPYLPDDNLEGYEPEATSCGLPTIALYDQNIKYYLHSNYRIINEAAQIARAWYTSEADTYYIYGIGLGYPVIELAEMNENLIVHVFESDLEILRLALTYTDFTQYIASGRILIHYDPDFVQLYITLEKLTEDAAFVIHYPSLRNIKNPIIKEGLEDYFINYSSVKNQRAQLDRNFKKNIQNYDASIDALRPIFKDKQLIIVAAGPSLDKNYLQLKDAGEDTIILSTGTVFHKLLKAGIHPDYVIISDATEKSRRQFEGLEKETVPLLFLSTAYLGIVKEYSGKKYLICQEGYSKAKEYALQAGFELFGSGGSVSTLALDVGIRLQCKSIITIGLDLAYTGQRDHASDTATLINMEGSELREVDAIGGGKVKTGKNLDIYRKWIEKRIQNIQSIQFINATEGGALIHGMENKKLSECLISTKTLNNT